MSRPTRQVNQWPGLSPLRGETNVVFGKACPAFHKDSFQRGLSPIVRETALSVALLISNRKAKATHCRKPDKGHAEAFQDGKNKSLPRTFRLLLMNNQNMLTGTGQAVQ